MRGKFWLGFLLAGALLGCRPDPEVCGDDVDNDEDNLTDCEDVTDCSADPACAENCTNGVDDNANGAVDCQEATCANDPACATELNCGDGVDNDGDNLTDCADTADCGQNAGCREQGNCADNTDNDLDGQTDCADVADCGNDPACQAGNTEDSEATCTDTIDNDADNFTDCEDRGCDVAPTCIALEDCTPGSGDEDGDNAADCADGSCTNDPLCAGLVEICNDGISNDADAFIDCDDFDCNNDPACAESNDTLCNDTQDNDNDGFVDCEDRSCDAAPICNEICDDTIDNDNDGNTDCADGSCGSDPSCNAGAVTIQDIQDGTIAVGASATVQNAFVTAVRVAANNNNVNLFIQAAQGQTDNGHTYPEFAGVQVFVLANQVANFPALNGLAVGDCITITGDIVEFRLSTEIEANATNNPNADIIKIADPATCGTFPQATTVTVDAIATDLDPNAANNQPGLSAEALEGVLVQIQNVTTLLGVDAGGDFIVNAGGAASLLIENFLFSNNNTALPAIANQTFTSIIGIYNEFTNNNDPAPNYRLQPRGAADLQ